MALSKNSLKGTISDVISVDEFEPKTGNKEELIVIAFYAIDEQPAKDMDTFLERSFIDLVDVEVSPNPNEDGYYLVFIEIKRDGSFFDAFEMLVKDVQRITGDMEWKISPYLSDNLFPLEDQRWKRFIIIDKEKYTSKEDFIKNKDKSDKQKQMKEAVMSYFKRSNITLFECSGNTIKIGGVNGVLTFNIKSFCTEKKMMEKYDFNTKPILWENSSVELRTLKSLLGEGWTAFYHDKHIVISNCWSNMIMRLEQ